MDAIASNKRSTWTGCPEHGHARRVDAVAAEDARDIAILLGCVDHVDARGWERGLISFLGASDNILGVGRASEGGAKRVAVERVRDEVGVPAAGGGVKGGDDLGIFDSVVQLLGSDSHRGRRGGRRRHQQRRAEAGLMNGRQLRA